MFDNAVGENIRSGNQLLEILTYIRRHSVCSEMSSNTLIIKQADHLLLTNVKSKDIIYNNSAQ